MQLNISCQVKDEAHLSRPPLTMMLINEAYGLAIAAHADSGEDMTSIALDYFDNQLRALVYFPDQEEPLIIVLVPDVAAARVVKPITAPPLEVST